MNFSTTTALLFLFIGSSLADVRLDVDWSDVVITSKTTPTCQAVTNPKYLRQSDIHKPIFDNLKKLNASYVRLAGWFPYPHLVVAELDAPGNGSTSWDFSYLDQIVEDFMAATGSRHPLLSLSTIPQWLFKTQKRVPYPVDPNQVDWDYSYSQGTELRDQTMKELGDYYKRLIQWYTRGGFTDELDHYHQSKHRYPIDFFEVFNEIEVEHKTSPQDYTKRYDAVVKAVREVIPDTKFVGLALGLPMQSGVEYVSYFLNRSNHQADVPLDYISYHFYAYGQATDTINNMQYSFYEQADKFIETVKQLEAIRLKLSPTTKVDLNEIGSMYVPATQQPNPGPIPDGYFQLSGANYAYIFTQLVPMGIDIIGMSQLVGFPSQFPSVAMLNWTDGTPLYRYAVLKLIVDSFVPGDRIVKTTLTGVNIADVAALSAVGPDGFKKILLVNKRLFPVEVEFNSKINYMISIDQSSNQFVKTVVEDFKVKLSNFDVVILYPKQNS